MGDTSRLHLPFPDSTDPPDVVADIEALALALDGSVPYGQGLFADRPVSTSGSPGIAGRLYFATDRSLVYYDTGTSWITIPPQLHASQHHAAGADPIIIEGRQISVHRSVNPPAGAVSGDIWITPSPSGGYWQYMYDSAETTAYKWKFIGGDWASQRILQGGSRIGVADGWGAGVHDLSVFGPAVDIYRAGIYRYQAQVFVTSDPADDAGMMVGIQDPSNGAFGGIDEVWAGASRGDGQKSCLWSSDIWEVAANRRFLLRYETLGANPTATWFHRVLMVQPVKVA
jgi:hypothetical protein